MQQTHNFHVTVKIHKAPQIEKYKCTILTSHPDAALPHYLNEKTEKKHCLNQSLRLYFVISPGTVDETFCSEDEAKETDVVINQRGLLNQRAA